MAVVIANTYGHQQSSGLGATEILAPQTVTAGSLLAIIFWAYTTTQIPSGVSDDVNGAWTKASISGADYVTSTGIGVRMGCYYKANASAGTTTITVTWDGGSERKGSYWYEITGLGGGGALDQCIGQGLTSVTSTTILAGTYATLAQASEALVIAYVGDKADTGMASGAGWTRNSDIDGFQWERGGRQVTSSTTPPTAGWDRTSASGSFVVASMAFKDVSAGGGTAKAAQTYYSMIGG